LRSGAQTIAELRAELLVCLGGSEREWTRRILRATKFTGVGREGNKRSMSAGGEAYIANGGDARLPRRLATQAGKQAACLHACARRCLRGGCAGQGPVILIGSL